MNDGPKTITLSDGDEDDEALVDEVIGIWKDWHRKVILNVALDSFEDSCKDLLDNNELLEHRTFWNVNLDRFWEVAKSSFWKREQRGLVVDRQLLRLLLVDKAGGTSSWAKQGGIFDLTHRTVQQIPATSNEQPRLVMGVTSRPVTPQNAFSVSQLQEDKEKGKMLLEDRKSSPIRQPHDILELTRHLERGIHDWLESGWGSIVKHYLKSNQRVMDDNVLWKDWHEEWQRIFHAETHCSYEMIHKWNGQAHLHWLRK